MKINMFPVWKSWLTDLGGSFDDTPEPRVQKISGRRDPDTKPRQYQLDPKKFATTERGYIVHLKETK